MFFNMTDIVKTCPDKKKMVAEPPEKRKCISTHYHLGTIRMLHWRFETETRAVCSLERFRQMLFVPHQTTGALAYVLHASTLK